MHVANHQYIHATGFKDFGKCVSRTDLSRPILGNGIFVADGAYWKYSRNKIKPVFAKAEISDIGFAAKHIDRFVHLLPRNGSTFDMQQMLKRLFIDLSTELLLGESIDAQAPKNDEAEDLLNAWDESLLGWNKRRQSSRLSIRWAFDRTWANAYQRVHRYFDHYVEIALSSTSKVPSQQNTDDDSSINDNLQGNDRRDSPRRYVLLYEMAKSFRDPVELRFELMNVFMPSRDTSAILASNVFFQLARHPFWWAKLREEANELGIDNINASSLTFEKLKGLRNCRYVINETLRSIGPAGRVFREAKVDTTLPTGGGADGRLPIFVPKGTTLCSSTFHIHHDPDIWGQDANEFKPERWEGRRTTWEFVPFLGGPRICPAQQQVLNQVTYLLLRVVAAFGQIENKDPVHEYVELQRMAIESRNGVKIALKAQRSICHSKNSNSTCALSNVMADLSLRN